MTTDHVAARTLVKSPPELWAECSDAASLARHLQPFGEITITRRDPESSVAWEAEEASGTVLIEPSAWGTRVTLTAQTKAEEVIEDLATPHQPVPESEAAEEEADAKVEETLAPQDPALAADPAPARGRWKRLIERTRGWFSPPVDELAPLPEGIVEEPAPPEEEIAPEPAPPAEEIAPEPEAIAEAPASEAAEPVASPETEPLGPPEPDDRVDPEAILSAALDSLGRAHHRPFSRA